VPEPRSTRATPGAPPRSASADPTPVGAPEPDVGDDDARDTYVTAFGRGLAVIRAFSESRPTMSIADVAKTTGLNRATARRFLHTLEADGYLANDGGRYSLRPRVLELGYAYLSSISVDEIVQQQLVALAERVHESCSAAVLDELDVVFVARARTSFPRVMTLALGVGTRIPAYLSAIGRVLLAELGEEELDAYLRAATLTKATPNTISDPAQLRTELAKIRAQNYCVMDQEIEEGILAAAVPVRRPNRQVIGISVAAHASRRSIESLERDYVPALLETAAELEQVLGFRNG
jgi:IclR family transcriptional regulator, pca regulon regulatory protein